MREISYVETEDMCKSLALLIESSNREYKNIYPVLRGGYTPAVILANFLGIPLTDNWDHGTLIVDDICDSGRTLARFKNLDKAVLFCRPSQVKNVTYYVEQTEDWIEFTWENTQQDDEDLVVRQLQRIGENPTRAGLVDTPRRVVKMWREIFRGYDAEQKPEIQVFNNGDDGLVYDQMILDEGDFYSHCEHHMVPFFGQYWFAYIPHPQGKIIGLSKVARLVDYHAARLQIQERLVNDVVEDIWNMLIVDDKEPLGMALVMRGEHLCKSMRGAKKKGTMTTSKMKGCFMNEGRARSEFLQLIK